MWLTIVSDVLDVVRPMNLALESDRGRLIICVERRRARFGRAWVNLSLERSGPAARFARRRRRLAGRVSSTSKSVGRNAAGALWKSTTVGAGRRSTAESASILPCTALCALLPKESSDIVLLILEKLGDLLEKLLVMLAMLNLRMTEVAEARI